MPLEMQVIAQNTKAQVVVLSSDPKGTEMVEWQPAGDPNGGDVQVIPEAIARSAAFTRLLHKGVIEILQADDEYQAAMAKQRAAFEARLAGAAQKAQESLDPEAKNDMLTLACIGPHCENLVPVREKTKDDRPVLCPTHEGLASQYIQSEEQVGTEIKKKWSRVTMTAPERATA